MRRTSTSDSIEILGAEVSQPQDDKARKTPKLAQLSSECEVRDGSAHLPGPSLEKVLNTREEIRQVPEDEARNIPRVAQLSSEPEQREGQEYLPGLS